MKIVTLKYFAIGFVMGFVLLVVFLCSLPDGKLHVVFCDVGQGDGAYLRLPDGRDMLIDAGPPTAAMLGCIGKHMPFWDRTIDVIIVTHSDKDHFGGVTDILRRYKVGTLLLNEVGNVNEDYKELADTIAHRAIQVRSLHAGDHMTIGSVRFYWLWPTKEFMERIASFSVSSDPTEIGAAVVERNDTSQVIHLRFGTFDVFFTGDAGQTVEPFYTGTFLSPDGMEVLKVPHHGSKAGMTDEFLAWLSPKLAVISVGKKNMYGHPSKEAISQLQSVRSVMKRTDLEGTIEVISDGNGWKIQ